VPHLSEEVGSHYRHQGYLLYCDQKFSKLSFYQIKCPLKCSNFQFQVFAFIFHVFNLSCTLYFHPLFFVQLKSKKRLSSSYDGTEKRPTSRPLTATSSWSPQQFEPYFSPNTTLRPKTATSYTSRKSFGTERVSPRSPENANATRKDVLNVTYGGDYLDRHQDRFCNAEGTPFTPRTKKRSAKSFLSQSKHYAPPVHSHKKKSVSKDLSSPKSKSNHKHITKEEVQRIDETDRYRTVFFKFGR